MTKINTDIHPAWQHPRVGRIQPIILLRINQLSHIDPGATVGQEHRQQDEAVRSTYQDNTQVHPVTKL